MICCARSVYVVQIQPRKRVLDHADNMALTRHRDLGHTDQGIYLI